MTEIRKIVAAACRSKAGIVVCGVRHFDALMWANILGMPPTEFRERQEAQTLPEKPPQVDQWMDAEQGFVDSYGTFRTRSEAFAIARTAKQFDPNGPDYRGINGSLFSEDVW